MTNFNEALRDAFSGYGQESQDKRLVYQENRLTFVEGRTYTPGEKEELKNFFERIDWDQLALERLPTEHIFKFVRMAELSDPDMKAEKKMLLHYLVKNNIALTLEEIDLVLSTDKPFVICRYIPLLRELGIPINESILQTLQLLSPPPSIEDLKYALTVAAPVLEKEQDPQKIAPILKMLIDIPSNNKKVFVERAMSGLSEKKAILESLQKLVEQHPGVNPYQVLKIVKAASKEVVVQVIERMANLKDLKTILEICTLEESVHTVFALQEVLTAKPNVLIEELSVALKLAQLNLPKNAVKSTIRVELMRILDLPYFNTIYKFDHTYGKPYGHSIKDIEELLKRFPDVSVSELSNKILPMLKDQKYLLKEILPNISSKKDLLILLNWLANPSKDETNFPIIQEILREMKGIDRIHFSKILSFITQFAITPLSPIAKILRRLPPGLSPEAMNALLQMITPFITNPTTWKDLDSILREIKEMPSSLRSTIIILLFKNHISLEPTLMQALRQLDPMTTQHALVQFFIALAIDRSNIEDMIREVNKAYHPRPAEADQYRNVKLPRYDEVAGEPDFEDI